MRQLRRSHHRAPGLGGIPLVDVDIVNTWLGERLHAQRSERADAAHGGGQHLAFDHQVAVGIDTRVPCLIDDLFRGRPSLRDRAGVCLNVARKIPGY